MLIRHFLLETVEEINDDLIKNNKEHRVNFGYNMLGHFLNENDTYCEKKEFYDVDGTFNNFKLFDHLEYLNKLVKSCSLGNKLFLNPKTIETDLPVLYLQKYFFILTENSNNFTLIDNHSYLLFSLVITHPHPFLLMIIVIILF